MYLRKFISFLVVSTALVNILFIIPVHAGEEKMKIAVYDLNVMGISEHQGHVLSDILREVISMNNMYEVMSSDEMIGVLKDKAISEKIIEDCDSDFCYDEIAEALAVDFLVTGKIKKISESYVINLYLRLVNQDSAIIIDNVNLYCAYNKEVLVRSIEEAVLDLLKKESAQKSAMTTIEDVTFYFNEGVDKLEKQQYEQAVFCFTMAINGHLNSADAYYFRGKCFAELGEYEQAIEDYTSAIEINPQHDKAYFQRGNVYYNNCLCSDIISDYIRKNEINSKKAQSNNNQVNIFKSYVHQYDKAISDYSMAIKINPEQEQAYINRGNTFYQYKYQYYNAISDYERAIEINPRSAEAYYNRAVACQESGYTDEAVESYNKYVQHASPQEEFLVTEIKDYLWMLVNYTPEEIEVINMVGFFDQ